MASLRSVTLFAVLIGTAALAGYSLGTRHSLTPSTPTTTSPKDHDELRRLHDEDQSDRSGTLGDVDWSVVEPRDRSRRERVKQLFAEGALNTANDYYHAAMILQHGDGPTDFIAAHELAIAAIIKGRRDARWLAAASEDRFLTNIGRLQRFGTQFRKDGDGPWYLETMDQGVADGLRQVMDVPSLAETNLRVVGMNTSK